MMERASLGILCLVQLVIVTVSASLTLAHGDSPDYASVTAQDPLIQKDHLEILLTPLTQDELAVEADAWMELVKEKVRLISNAEIAVKFNALGKDVVGEERCNELRELIMEIEGEATFDRFFHSMTT